MTASRTQLFSGWKFVAIGILFVGDKNGNHSWGGSTFLLGGTWHINNFRGKNLTFPFGIFWRIILTVNIIYGKKSLPTTVKFDKGSLESRFYPSNPSKVYVTLDLFSGGGFNVKINQALIFDDCHTNLLSVGGIHQHTFGHFTVNSYSFMTPANREEHVKRPFLPG